MIKTTITRHVYKRAKKFCYHSYNISSKNFLSRQIGKVDNKTANSMAVRQVIQNDIHDIEQ